MPPLCRQPIFLLSLSAKVEAMFGLLEANLDLKRNAVGLVVMSSASTQGINVTCEVLDPNLLCGCHIKNER